MNKLLIRYDTGGLHVLLPMLHRYVRFGPSPWDYTGILQFQEISLYYVVTASSSLSGIISSAVTL